MKIKNVRLYNFRQFKEMSIDFSTSSDKNVTIILAENSTGKTTLMQSLKWCLYGEEEMELDKPENLLNFLVQDTSNREQEEIFVELVIEEEGLDYTIRRTRTVLTKNSKTVQEKISISYNNSNGEFISHEENITSSSMELKKINRMINKILSKEMSRYFLFDGERINTLGSNTRKSREDIKSAISAINGFYILDNALDSLKQLKRSYKKTERERIGSKQLNNLHNEITKLEKEKKELTQELTELTQRIQQEELQISQLDDDLVHFEDVKKLVNDRMRAEKDIKIFEERLGTLRKRLLSDYYNYRYQSQIIQLNEKYKVIEMHETYEENTISNMQANAIDEILSRGICICGEPITASHKEHLLTQRNYQPPISNAQLIKEFELLVSKEVAGIDTLVDRIEEDKAEYIRLADDIISKNEEKDALTLKIDQTNSNDIKDKNKFREKLKSELSNDKNNLLLNERLIQDIDNNVLNKENEYNKLLEQKKRDEYEKIKMDLIDGSIELLNAKNDDERKARKVDIENLANKHFKDIIYKNKQISLNDNFEFTVLEENGEPASSSEGERTAVSMSLIIAIIEAHKKITDQSNNSLDYANKREFTVVLDAAFATLDSEFSRAISSKLPQSIEQIILFSSRKQFEGTVEEGLSDSIGKIYELPLSEAEHHNALISSDLKILR